MQWLSRIRAAIGFDLLPAGLRKLIVGVIGVTILLIGVAMVVLPGPAFIMIPVGLGVLATEFTWARRMIRRARVMIGRARSNDSGKPRPTVGASR